MRLWDEAVGRTMKIVEQIVHKDQQGAMARKIQGLATTLGEAEEALRWAKKMNEDYFGDRRRNDESDGDEGQCWRAEDEDEGG